jgi:hypothetical protein
MIWAQVSLYDLGNEPGGNCEMAINGTAVPSTSTAFTLKSGTANLTIVSAATLTPSSNTIEIDCQSSDSTTVASVNLSLVTVDALN